MFKEYQYGSFKGEIKNLLRKRLSLLDKIRRHKKRAEYHEAQVQLIENDTLKDIEKQLDILLKKTGNK